MAAVVLYLHCRMEGEKQPYLLVDFSEELGIDLYVLGQTYLKLHKELCRQIKHEQMRIPNMDPSFFINKFCKRLFDDHKSKIVAKDAFKILRSMSRDWISTG